MWNGKYLIVTPQNGTKAFINKKGEVVINMRPRIFNVGRKEVKTDAVSFRVEDVKDDKHTEIDRGWLNVSSNNALGVHRK